GLGQGSVGAVAANETADQEEAERLVAVDERDRELGEPDRADVYAGRRGRGCVRRAHRLTCGAGLDQRTEPAHTRPRRLPRIRVDEAEPEPPATGQELRGVPYDVEMLDLRPGEGHGPSGTECHTSFKSPACRAAPVSAQA